jgi:hypothetical protein
LAALQVLSLENVTLKPRVRGEWRELRGCVRESVREWGKLEGGKSEGVRCKSQDR